MEISILNYERNIKEKERKGKKRKPFSFERIILGKYAVPFKGFEIYANL